MTELKIFTELLLCLKTKDLHFNNLKLKKEVINTKYFYVTYETRDGEHEYQEAGVLQANDYKLALEKAIKAKPLYDRYGWEEFCRQDEVIEITKAEYTVLRKFMLDIDYYFNEDGKLRI